MAKRKLKYLIITAVMAVFLFSGKTNAHPGRTASDGCHYCRTNCAKWGEVEGARHCHGGYTAPVVETVPVAPVVVSEPSPTPVVIQIVASPTPSPKPSLKPKSISSPTPKPTQVSSPTSKLSSSPQPSPIPEVLGEDVDSGATEGWGVGVLLGYIFWRAIKQKWPFHAE